MSVLDRVRHGDALSVVRRHARFQDLDVAAVTRACIAWNTGPGPTGQAHPDARPVSALMARWWLSVIDRGDPDYSTYTDPFYVADLWSCWVTYSRPYLRTLDARLDQGGFLFDRAEIRSVLDLGCGFGWTTAAFRDLFPDASVTGTNLPGTAQYLVAESYAPTYGFRIAPEDTEGPHDLVFASEYFEHHEDPIAHARVVVDRYRPRWLVEASTFGQPSIGHFPEYPYRGPDPVYGRAFSTRFGQALRDLGYQPVPAGFWNNRPRVWGRL